MACSIAYTVKVLVVSGRSGSGKSRATYEAAYILRQHNLLHVNIDGDNLNTMYPSPANDSEIMFQNLRAFWSTYWQHACTLWSNPDTNLNHKTQIIVLINGTGIVMNMERIEATIREVIFTRTDFTEANTVTIQLFPVILKASEHTATQRLIAREIGGELEDHLTSTRRMDLLLNKWTQEQNTPVTCVLNEGRDVHDVALEILRTIGLQL